LVGATQPAKTEQKTQMKAISAAHIAVGEERKLWPMSLSSQRFRGASMVRAVYFREMDLNGM
jgi:hypothetical protein